MLNFPWGDTEPIPGKHGNFNFFSWAPTPVNQFPEGRSKFGLMDCIGNGFEWTCSPFYGHPGFEPYLPSYQAYSKDFFDGKHFVLLGASWATATPLVRRSFRNWFQPHYQFIFGTFRLCS